MIDKVRELALKVLYKIDKEEAYSNIALNEIINANREKLTPKRYRTNIRNNIWSNNMEINIRCNNNKTLKNKNEKISTWVLNILRMGIYQILFLDKIPQSAAVNESVNLAKDMDINQVQIS